MKQKLIKDEELRKLLEKQKKPPIPSLSNVIMMKEQPPDKTKELLDPEDWAKE
jgi:hypothetical protein